MKRTRQQLRKLPVYSLIACLVLQQSVFSVAVYAKDYEGTFTVNEETPSLCVVALYLYGHCSMHRQIAKWNGMTDPNRLKEGQKLILRRRPTLTPEEGRAKLLWAFRRKFGLSAKGETSRPAKTAAPAPTPTPTATHEVVQQLVQETLKESIQQSLEPGTSEATPSPAPEAKSLSKKQQKKAEAAKIEAREKSFEKLMDIANEPPKVVTIEEPAPEVTPTPPEPGVQAQPAPEASASPSMPAPKPVPTANPVIVAVVKQRAIEENFDKGKELFEKKDYEAALETFHLNREKNPKFLPAWVYELRTLQALKREDEARVLARQMVEVHPQTRMMPLLRPYLEGGQ